MYQWNAHAVTGWFHEQTQAHIMKLGHRLIEQPDYVVKIHSLVMMASVGEQLTEGDVLLAIMSAWPVLYRG